MKNKIEKVVDQMIEDLRVGDITESEMQVVKNYYVDKLRTFNNHNVREIMTRDFFEPRAVFAEREE